MRKIILLPFSLLAVVTFFSSCKKESISTTPATVPTATLNVSASASQPYQMDLSSLGTVSISKQAVHYSVSEAQVSETGARFYKYVPAAGYAGNDEVQLVSVKSVVMYSQSNGGGCRSSNNNSASTASTTTVSQNITLKISVSN